jgi:hypothetical protein
VAYLGRGPLYKLSQHRDGNLASTNHGFRRPLTYWFEHRRRSHLPWTTDGTQIFALYDVATWLDTEGYGWLECMHGEYTWPVYEVVLAGNRNLGIHVVQHKLLSLLLSPISSVARRKIAKVTLPISTGIPQSI